jgi:dephospho-CoA kinase
MYVVGITGGIGSGKSTVVRHFSDLGVPVLDTDQVARDVVAPGSAVLDEIKAYFGPGALNSDGSLNRAYLRQTIFTDDQARQQLESLLHPLIRQQCKQWLAQQQANYAILVIPLLFEKGWEPLCDRILVVDVDEATQIERVMTRDGLNEAQVKEIMATQVSRQTRCARANDIINNESAAAELQLQVARLHQQYLDLAREKRT